MGNNKQVFEKTPSVKRKQVNDISPDSYKSKSPAWRLDLLDLDGQWGWKRLLNYVTLADLEVVTENLHEETPSEIFDILDTLCNRNFNDTSSVLHKVETRSKLNLKRQNIFAILKGLDRQYFFSQVLPKLTDFESMTWNLIVQATHGRRNKTKHHNVRIEKLCTKARQRLDELNLCTYSELYSLRLSGKERIWGIRKGHNFHIIWYDPLHEVCPSLRD